MGELDWKKYEQITKYIYGILGQRYGIKIRGYGKDCKVRGKSGVEHQIDVLTEQSDSRGLHLTAIECKFLNQKVTKETVMKLHSEMQDAEIESGIIVCKSGFTKDTLAYAEHVGIKLVEFREAAVKDMNVEKTMNVGVLAIRTKAIIRRPIITRIDLGSEQIIDEHEIMAMHYSTVLISEGKKVPFKNYMMSFSEELHRQPLLQTTSREYQPVIGKIERGNNNDIIIEKISFAGFLIEIDASVNRSFRLTDQVWMIMKEIFDKKSYLLSENGMIYDVG
ncbi:restriction endonuclease [Niabella sp. CJ426]|uniref:restriction endonuclease n=1 Tax=Niabella sp. CJ426 TaxID=3393740 RepID=UPI003D08320E